MKMYERLKVLEEIADSVQNILGTSTEGSYEVTFYEEDDTGRWVGVKIKFSKSKTYSIPDMEKLIRIGADILRPLFDNAGWRGVELYWYE